MVLGELTHAERQLMEAELEQRQYQVWFWRWKPEARREVEARRPAVEAAQERVREVRGERNRVLREAKLVLGLWSGEPWGGGQVLPAGSAVQCSAVGEGGQPAGVAPFGQSSNCSAAALLSSQTCLVKSSCAFTALSPAEAGVEEGREVFWESFAFGKVFAQRQSFLDAIFTILGGRERDWLSLLLQLLFQVGAPRAPACLPAALPLLPPCLNSWHLRRLIVNPQRPPAQWPPSPLVQTQTLINFFTGMCVSVFVFLFQLPSLIWSYQPALVSPGPALCCAALCCAGVRPQPCSVSSCAPCLLCLCPLCHLQWSGVAFFALAAVAAISVVAGYLGLLFGAGATAAYATVSLAAQQQQRLEAAAQQRRRIAYGREHHD